MIQHTQAAKRLQCGREGISTSIVPFVFSASVSSVSKAILPSPQPRSKILAQRVVATFVIFLRNSGCKPPFSVGISEGFILIQFCAGNMGRIILFTGIAPAGCTGMLLFGSGERIWVPRFLESEIFSRSVTPALLSTTVDHLRNRQEGL